MFATGLGCKRCKPVRPSANACYMHCRRKDAAALREEKHHRGKLLFVPAHEKPFELGLKYAHVNIPNDMWYASKEHAENCPVPCFSEKHGVSIGPIIYSVPVLSS